MPSIIDIAVGVFLAYYSTGYEMLIFHSQLSPVDRPGYVSESTIKRFFAGLGWPIVAKLNGELAWFFVCFISASTLFTFLHAVLYPYTQSSGIVVLAIMIARILPVVSLLISGPLALIAMLIWVIFAKPFGAKAPSGMEQMQKK